MSEMKIETILEPNAKLPIKYSIIFSIRNRIKEMMYSVPSMIVKYRDRPDVELVALDDGSNDGGSTYLRGFAKDTWTNRITLLKSIRKDEYDWCASQQYNELVKKANGEYLVVQNAETVHVDNIVDELSVFCKPKHASFATVFNCVHPSVNDDLKWIMQTTLADRKLPTPFFPSGCEDAIIDHLTVKGFASASSLGHLFPQRTLVIELNKIKRVFKFFEFCSVMRPVPWFFCGMITKNDWENLGGYAESPNDVNFGLKMAENNFLFTFSSALAIHISHEKK